MRKLWASCFLTSLKAIEMIKLGGGAGFTYNTLSTRENVIYKKYNSSQFLFCFRDIQRESFHQSHSSWFHLSFVYNHYLFFGCILVVTFAIGLYLLRLRRIHHQPLQSAPLDLLWLEEVVPLPVQKEGS